MKRNFFFRSVIGLLGIGVIVLTYLLYVTPLFVQIPIAFAPCRTPLIKVKIEENVYDLKLDLGSKFQLSLNKNVLKILNKTLIDTARWRDGKGNSYESPSFKIPRVQIEELSLKDVYVKQEHDDYLANTTLWNDKPGTIELGMLGRPILEKTNLLLDCSRAKIVATNSKRMLKQAGYDLEQMIRIPIEVNKRGIVVKVDVDVGLLKLLIDTGSTLTLVRSSTFQTQQCEEYDRELFVYKSSKFIMGKNDFGRKNLYLYEITPDLNEIDGVLGMDFLENHIVYFDYKHKAIYIAP